MDRLSDVEWERTKHLLRTAGARDRWPSNRRLACRARRNSMDWAHGRALAISAHPLSAI